MPWRLWRRRRPDEPVGDDNGGAAAAARAAAEERLRATQLQQQEVSRLVDSLGADIQRSLRGRHA